MQYVMGREPRVAHLPSFLCGCAIQLLSRMCSSWLQAGLARLWKIEVSRLPTMNQSRSYCNQEAELWVQQNPGKCPTRGQNGTCQRRLRQSDVDKYKKTVNSIRAWDCFAGWHWLQSSSSCCSAVHQVGPVSLLQSAEGRTGTGRPEAEFPGEG
jgi:hypothetical protein